MPIYPDFFNGIDSELSADIGARIITHRNRFARIFRNRYLEMLPTVITYYNGETVAVDWLKVEVALRNGFDVVIGQNAFGVITMLGYSNNKMTPSNPVAWFGAFTPLAYRDVIWTIPHFERPSFKTFKEITKADDCKTGTFVVLRNKTINYNNDIEIINHYTNELAEVVVSRFSITMQAKIMTFFTSEEGDETINQIVTDFYNGVPYAKTDEFFDPEDQMITYTTENIPALLTELKREYQNKISELNNMIGMNSLAVEKSSGVSDTEANSNRAFTTSNGNIYLDGRNNPLKCLNKRFGKQIYAMYNDDSISKSTLIEIKTGEESDNMNENNDDTNGHDTIGTPKNGEE